MERRGFVKALVGSVSLIAAAAAVYSIDKGSNKKMYTMLTFDNAASAKNYNDFSQGDRVLISDRGFFYEFNEARRIVSDNEKSEVKFDDDLIILVESGGMLIFSDIEKAKSIHTINSSKFHSKIKDRNSPITIDCFGDSITFGQALPETPGAKNMSGNPTLFGDGSTHQNWQFNGNYPEKLRSTFNKFMPQLVSVKNCGYSGDRAWTAYLRHRDTHTADMAIIMYGINDCLYASLNGSNPKDISDSDVDSVEKYASVLRLFALRQIVNGKTCVLVGSTTFASPLGYDGSNLAPMKLVRAYNSACKSVAEELGCMYIDPPTEMFSQYGIGEITQEGTHLSEIGMSIFANKLFAAIVSIEHVSKAGHGSIIVLNPITIPIMSKSDVVALPNDTSSTPRGTIYDKKTTINVTEKGVCIPFFTCCPDLVLFINGLCSYAGAQFSVSIDGESIQSDYHYQGYATQAKPDSVKNLYKAKIFNRSNCNISDDKDAFIKVSAPGWHYLEVRKISGGASVLIDSMSFENIKDVLSDDVFGCTAKATMKGSSLINNLNISSIIKTGVGLYRFTFKNEMYDADYNVSVNPSSDFNANIFRVHDKSKQGFSVSFMQGAGIGKGIDFQLYDPQSISVSVTGGR